MKGIIIENISNLYKPNKIGYDFGKRDHTTVIHACNKISKDINENNELKNTVEELKKLILY